MAKKNPWYPMYASDWNNDTAEWPLEADGARIRLMNHQAINGSLPSDMPSLARICRVHTKVITRLYRVYLQFKFDSNGFRMKNKRLSLVLEEQAAKQLSLSERGKKGATKQWPSHPRKDSILESESDIEIKKEKKESNTLSGKPDDIPFSEVVSHLNETINSNYRSGSGKTQSLIRARWKEGFRLKDFYAVHKIKSAEWLNTEYGKFLRPETLYGPKFESYLNQSSVPKPKTNEQIFEEKFG